MHYLRKVPKSPQGVLKPKSCMGVNAQLCLYHLLHFTEGTEDQKSQDVSLNVLAKLLQVCPTLCDPMNYSPDCSSVQAPLSMGFPRQEYRSALPCLSPGDQPNPGMEPVSLASTALAGRFFFYHCTTWEAPEPKVSCQRISCVPGMDLPWCRSWSPQTLWEA